jgi:hypothetical protein
MISIRRSVAKFVARWCADAGILSAAVASALIVAGDGPTYDWKLPRALRHHYYNRVRLSTD